MSTSHKQISGTRLSAKAKFLKGAALTTPICPWRNSATPRSRRRRSPAQRSTEQHSIEHVSFTGADLRSTSFWGAILDPPSTGHFANTAWWFADGWTSPQIMELVKLDQSKLKDNRFLNGEYREKDRESVRDTGAGTYDRAYALNVLAWTLATWGVDIAGTNAASAQPAQTCDKVMESTDVPDNALDAADQAICIAKRLNESGG